MSRVHELQEALRHPTVRSWLLRFRLAAFAGIGIAVVATLFDVLWAWKMLAMLGIVSLFVVLGLGAFVLARVKLALDYQRAQSSMALENLESGLSAGLAQLCQDTLDLQRDAERSRLKAAEDLDGVNARFRALEDQIQEALSSLEQLARVQFERVAALEADLASRSKRLQKHVETTDAELKKVADGLQRKQHEHLNSFESRLNESTDLLASQQTAAEDALSQLSQRLDDERSSWERHERLLAERLSNTEERWSQMRFTIDGIQKEVSDLGKRIAGGHASGERVLSRAESSIREDLRILRKRLADDLSRVEERSSNAESSIRDLEGRLRTASDPKKLDQRFREVEERQKTSDEAWRLAVSEERSRSIVALARRQAKACPLKRVLLIVCPNRTGSTWLFDALRCHPRIEVDPTFRILQLLGLGSHHNRYPGALLIEGNGQDIELRRGVGATIPRFEIEGDVASRWDLEELERLSIEKLHPEFFDWNARRFASSVARLERELNRPVEMVYRVRDPREAILSMWRYKQRDPNWYRALEPALLPSFFARTWESLEELSRLRSGLVVDYQGHLERPTHTLVDIYRRLWPEASSSSIEAIAAQARHLTDRALRRAADSSAVFFADSGGPVSAGDVAEMERWTDESREAMTRCYRAYQAIRERPEGSGPHRNEAPAPGPSRLEASR